MTMVYAIADICDLRWLGDSYEEAVALKDRWGKILGNIRTELDQASLRDLLVEQLSTPKELESDI